jgi:hypothetical protein
MLRQGVEFVGATLLITLAIIFVIEQFQVLEMMQRIGEALP